MHPSQPKDPLRQRTLYGAPAPSNEQLAATPLSAPQAPGPEREPEGFGEAVQAAALMLALATAFATVGFLWQRNHANAAQAFAMDLVQRVARHGDDALVPAWSGLGLGPTSASARNTFRALRGMGRLTLAQGGRCEVRSRFSLCSGTRYRCQVSGSTPAGLIHAAIGLCDAGSGAPYSFDSFDLTVPVVGDDRGNRADVDVGRDGMIRYGTTPLPPEALPVRLHQRAPLGPIRW